MPMRRRGVEEKGGGPEGVVEGGGVLEVCVCVL